MEWVAAGLVGCAGGLFGLRYVLTRRIAHILTGEQRRALFPLERPLSPGAEQALNDDELEIQRRLVRIKDGSQLFYQAIKPKHKAVTHILVFKHGYMSNSDLMLHFTSEFARSGALVLCMDLPGHGRSDGMLTYIPDWFAWVDLIWEGIELMMAQEAPKPCPPTFVAGGSLGGGLACCLCLQRPSFFRGAILMCPMLTVSDDVKPPWLVQQVFKRIIAPLLPTWPITPVKALEDNDFREVGQGRQLMDNNVINMKGLSPWLGTGLALGFTYPDWLDEQLSSMRTAFLLQHGTSDKVTDPATSKKLQETAAVKDKTLLLYDGVWHGELMCCTPGCTEHIQWTPEQIEATNKCVNDAQAWMSERLH